jgi:hypothetical protein
MMKGHFTVRARKWAGIAGAGACAACCAIPMLALAGVGGGASAALTRFLRPGAEVVAGLLVFAGVLTATALRRRLRGGR